MSFVWHQEKNHISERVEAAEPRSKAWEVKLVVEEAALGAPEWARKQDGETLRN